MTRKRIGLLLIHGIGDQGPKQHLQHVLDSITRQAGDLFGDENVGVQMLPGGITATGSETVNKVPQRGEPPDATIVIRTSDLELLIDLHEVWWRDLGKRESAISVLGFWAWAISLAGTKGRVNGRDTESYVHSTTVQSVRGWLGWYRTHLLLRITLVFILLFPFHIVFLIASIIPFVGRLHLFRTVFTYLSSLQLYVEDPRAVTGTTEDFRQPRRHSIHRRTIERLVSVATSDYDEWYVLGHSLGSVIAHRVLNMSPRALARLVSYERWHSLGAYRCSVSDDAVPHVDEPVIPPWLKSTDAISPALIFSRLRGLVTYGSPIMTFSHVWSNLVPYARDGRFGKDFVWVNLYDPIDAVASPIEAVPSDASIPRPRNLVASSSRLLFSAHTAYFKYKGKQQDGTLASLTRWLTSDSADRDAHYLTSSSNSPRDRHTLMKRVFALLQFQIVLVVGLAIWPLALSKLADVLIPVADNILEKVQPDLTDDDARLQWFRAHNPFWQLGKFVYDNLALDGRLGHNVTVFISIVGTILALVAVASATRYVLATLRSRFGHPGRRANRAVFIDK